MKTIHKEIISYLEKQSNWVDSATLAAVFSLSTRTIRNYVKEIRDENSNLILSSYKGYKLNPDVIQNNSTLNLDENNESYVIRRLISSNTSISVYDLADEMYISDSQFERILHSVKAFLSRFNLSINRKRNRININGEELDKRKLINYLIINESFNGFLVVNNMDSFLEDGYFDDIKKNLKEILEKNELIVDDYGFHSILIHLIIVILRVKNNNSLYSNDNNYSLTTCLKEQHAVKDINNYIKKLYGFSLSDAEQYHLTLIISGNSRIDIHESNFTEYISKDCITITNQILQDLKENYCLDDFSSEFKTNFMIHISNLLSRASHNTFTQNPLANSFKEQYPLIYDMATFVIKELNDYQAFRITDDEIAFIAFHIGTYLEQNAKSNNCLNATLIYVDYQNVLQYALKQIEHELSSIVHINAALSVHDLHSIPEHTDFLISYIGKIPDVSLPSVEVSLLMSQADIDIIRNMANKINTDKQKGKIRDILNTFIGKELFKKEFYCENKIEMIKALGNECIKMDLCTFEFIENVLEREELSSTAFKNKVAIPHSLKPSAKYPFLSIVSNSKPMKWDDNEVNIIILLGISKKQQTAFKMILDVILQLLYEVDNVMELCKCQTYNEFIDTLINLMD